MAVKPIPDGYSTVTPYLVIENSPEFIKFLKKAFNAKAISVSKSPDGKIMHAEIRIGNSMLMLSESSDKFPVNTGLFYMYVENVDATYKQAVGAGAVSESEPTDQFYGDRTAGVKDKFGNTWWIGTHIEDLTEEEMKKKEEEYFKNK